MTGPRPSRPRWRGRAREPLDLQPKARSNAKDGETRVFCFAMESPEKALDAGKHERSAIARPAEAQPVFGLHASFEAAWRPAHGEAQGFRLRTKRRFAHARRQP